MEDDVCGATYRRKVLSDGECSNERARNTDAVDPLPLELMVATTAEPGETVALVEDSGPVRGPGIAIAALAAEDRVCAGITR